MAMDKIVDLLLEKESVPGDEFRKILSEVRITFLHGLPLHATKSNPPILVSLARHMYNCILPSALLFEIQI